MDEQTKPLFQKRNNFLQHTRLQKLTQRNITQMNKLAKCSRIIKSTLKLMLTVISVPFQQKPLLQDDITLLKQGVCLNRLNYCMRLYCCQTADSSIALW